MPVVHQLAMIPFGIFAVCCMLQFYVYPALGHALRQRHPTVWSSLKRGFIGWPFYDRENGFAFSGVHRALNDPLLTRRVRAVRVLTIVALASWGAVALSMFAG